jgi:AI-2 transport protein TqsA
MKHETPKSISTLLISVASVIVIIAGLRTAQPIIVPFILSIFIAMICAGPMFWLKSKKLSTATSIAIIILCVIGVGYSVGYLFGSSLKDFSNSLPQYQESFTKLSDETSALIAKLGITLPEGALLKYLNPGSVMNLVTNVLSELSGVLANAVLILMAVIFMLIEASSFPEKLRKTFGNSVKKNSGLSKFSDSIKRYMAIKTGISLLTGTFICIGLALLGVDYPLLWGVLAFLLNYVPTFGSFLASIPALLLALITGGPMLALFSGLVYVSANVLIENFIEPRILGKGLGLSALVVFLSLVFWGWVLGPVGMLLSVPLTITFKIALESSAETKKFAELLS